MIYYANNNMKPSCKGENNLKKENFLSEFCTPNQKEFARDNLGITDIIKSLDTKIDAKVIESGNMAWDLIPTKGNFDKVLSSDSLYQTLLNYTLRTETDQQWSNILKEVKNTQSKFDTELNLIYQNLLDKIEQLRNLFNQFTSYFKTSGSSSTGIKFISTINEIQEGESLETILNCSTNDGLVATKIEIYKNDNLIKSVENTNSITFTDTVSDKTYYKAIVEYMGIIYTEDINIPLKKVSYVGWIGGGENYSYVMNDVNKLNVEDNLEKDIKISLPTDNSYFYLILPENFKATLTMNTYEINMEVEDSITIEDKNYIVESSFSDYFADTYDIHVKFTKYK